ncbi:MAG TPA: glycoside hydrolase family 2 protein [Ruminiclostridium sp.]
MKQFSLNGNWQMNIIGQEESIEANVPGSVYSDMLNASKMTDPYWRDNEVQAFALMDNDFEYYHSFSISEDLLNSDLVLLRCEGLDTIASITINGIVVGSTYNMHRTWEFDVKGALKAGENEIRIYFSSPTQFIKEEYKKCKADGSDDATQGFPHIRKAHCMFGWDWGPRLPDAGIWRNISIIGVDKARLDSVYISQKHSDNLVVLDFDINIAACRGWNEVFDINISVIKPDGAELVLEKNVRQVVIENPQLWWPNGYGKQPLYSVQVEISFNGIVLDKWERKIGLRTMTMSLEKDEWGESFAHMVNGIKIFAMGADYIPEDNIFSRINADRTRKLLNDSIEANFNTVRIWGGGYYLEDYFYDICDELGLLVWQDFMFACAVYELTPEFAKNIKQEIIDNVVRIRHHACLGLWCGNNEMEMFVDKGLWVNTHKQKADYIRMYEYLIPEILLKYDPNTFYWPASPSSGGGFDAPNDPNRGDVHYWDVWHSSKAFTDYRNYHFRYVSEFGFQSFPSTKTIETFTEPEDRNIFSYAMEKHQRNNAANGKIVNYLSQTYLYPTNFEVLIYASQLLQAEALRYGVEHWRRNRGRCMGAIYWQLNDCWPVASWASIDYFGRWKALHYYAKRFFAPVMISCCEEGILTQNTNVNAEPYLVEKSARLSVANETMLAVSGLVKWELRDSDAKVLKEGSWSVNVPELESIWLDKLDFADAKLYENYFSYSFLADGNIVSNGTILFCAPKHFKFKDPDLTYRIEGDSIVVKASRYAKSVEIDCTDTDIRLSDNYFDMNAGEKVIRITEGTPSNIILRSVFDIK